MTSPSSGPATCRFYAELNDFLSPEWKGRPIPRIVETPGAVKDFIEGIGVPHTEVELILVNGRPAVFSDLVRGGDRVSVYPVFRAVDLGPIPRLRPPRPAAVRFVLDVHLGRLAAYLRLAGFDAVYRNHCPDETLAAMAHGEARILLTRDRELLKRRIVDWGYWVRETRPHRQLAEVIRRFGLGSLLRPFSRCGRCNAPLEQVPKAAVKDRVPPGARRAHEQFHRCTGCGQVYWRGSHVEAIERLLEYAVGRSSPPPSG